MLWSAYPGLAIFVGTWAACFVSLSWLLATRARPFAVTAAAARSETTGKVVDAVTNLTNTRLFARLGFERGYLDRQLKHELVTIRRSNHYAERVRWFPVHRRTDPEDRHVVLRVATVERRGHQRGGVRDGSHHCAAHHQ